MNFKDLEELKKHFLQGKFKPVKDITVSDLTYHLRSSPNYSIEEMINKNYKGMIIYQIADSHKEEEKAAGLNQWIIFLWGFTPKTRMVPYDVRTMSRARAQGKTIVERADNQDNVIGSTVELRFTNLPGSNYIKGKVDTGATICSLHADEYKINRDAGTITFKSPELSRNELTVPMVDQQSVKSADGGSEYRPVIELNIKVNGKLLSNIKFNLNDRSHMEFPILVGKNALAAGKFLIDPKMDEAVDWTTTTTHDDDDDIDWIVVQEEIKLTEPVYAFNVTEVDEIYQIIKESDITFADIIRYIRTDVTENVMDDLDS